MVDLRPIGFVLGALLLILAGVMLIPLALVFSLDPDSSNWRAFVASSALCAVAGLGTLALGSRTDFRLSPRQMYVLTVASWVVLSGFCALPFMLSSLRLGLTDSVFEAISGLTTTGSTILTGLEELPRSILLWRALLQWGGGIGIIVMVVAILPQLRVGGMRLFQTEASDKSEKITARAEHVARSIGLIYVALSVLCALAYWLAGMDAFNAGYHAMTTISTGGYSTSDLSMRQFVDTEVLWVSIVFMLLSGLPFVRYVQLVRGKPSALLRDQQVRGFLAFLIIVIGIMALWLATAYHQPAASAVEMAAFSVVSIVTTTGYASVDYGLWGGFGISTMFFLTFVGGCAGSTAGGIKVFRFQIAALMMRNQARRMIHPTIMTPYRYNEVAVTDEVIMSVIAFSFVYASTVAALAVALSFTGLDVLTSLSGAATAVANVGPGLGDTIGPAGSFGSLPLAAKWLLSLGMLMGRLELMTVLVLFSPVFWRG